MHDASAAILPHFARQANGRVLRTRWSYATLNLVSLKQKAIVAALALGNVVVIAALTLLVVRGTRGSLEASLPTVVPVPAPLSPTPTPFDRYAASVTALERSCSSQAAQLMAYMGLHGAAAWRAGESLRVEGVFPLAPEQSLEDAAQAVWSAFDVALALRRVENCAGFREVIVTVRVPGEEAVRIEARVDADDLAAYRRGALDEAALIERVEYAVRRDVAR